MAGSFSLSDTIHIAFGSCLPCLKPASNSGEDSPQQQDHNHNPAINRIPRARPDELQGLLADADTDVEAETLSLHSNPGRSAQRNRHKKKRRSKKTSDNPRRITLFGYDLFGRAGPPPIQLPDGDDALYNEPGRRQRRSSSGGSLTPNTIVTAHSTASTFDSDAAPLDAATIAALSSPTAAAAAIEAASQATEAETQRLREKEERRQRRREKKELKRMAEALASQGVVGDGDTEGFEGFQGSSAQAFSKSGSGYRSIPAAMFPGRPTSDSGSGSAFSGSAREGFGRFVSAPAPPPGPYVPPPNEDDDDAADLDGGMYARKAPRGAATGGGGSHGSDSHSRTSGSRSDRAHQFPDPRNVFAHIQSHSYSHSPSRLSSPSQPTFQPAASTVNNSEGKPTKKKSSKSSSSRTTRSHSSAATSQSPSLPSPISPAFSASAQEVVSPSTVEQGQGFFDLEDELPVRKRSPMPSAGDAPKLQAEFPTTRIGGGGAGFPSTGFGGGGTKRTRDFGAFLARRGDEDEGVDGL
ncbi:hypothetical protein BDZ97DRAFT_1790850 [Flammula alnicola]|nr:hypothetical protein BDZ97DRAFT_1790850 [Flammula alnicola]